MKNIEIDDEELRNLKEQAYLEGVIGTLYYLKSSLEKEGEPKEVLGKALEEVTELGTTAVSLMTLDVVLHKFARRVLRTSQDFEPVFNENAVDGNER